MTETTLPLQPIKPDFVDNFRAGTNQWPQIQEFVNSLVATGLKNIAFVGAGGSIIASYPAFYLLRGHSDLPVYQIQSDEFNTIPPKSIGKGTLVVIASYTGTTKETVAAAHKARELGASIVAIGKADSPLLNASDLPLIPESDIVEFLVAVAVLAATGSNYPADKVLEAIKVFPEVLKKVAEDNESRMQEIAEAFQNEDMTYVLASGAHYGWAYGLAMCYLQEMQWMKAAAFNCGEFFQGAFEVFDDETAVILIMGEDGSRPMAERTKRFLDKFCKRTEVIDVRELDLSAIPEAVRGDLGPIVIRVLMDRLAKHYEFVRNHNLEDRHYMFKMDY